MKCKDRQVRAIAIVYDGAVMNVYSYGRRGTFVAREHAIMCAAKQATAPRDRIMDCTVTLHDPMKEKVR